MNIISKKELIEKLKEIRRNGWIQNARPGNQGGVGNTIEDILGIEENNLPIPNASEWELKCQRKGSASLTTLFHMEPSPRAIGFVPNILLPKYSWQHNKAGIKYPESEMSFRQTINASNRTDRGFGVIVNHDERKIIVSFDSNYVDVRHSEWLKTVEDRIGLRELEPQPYWGFDDLFHRAGTKLPNCFYLQADVKRKDGIEYFCYNNIMMLERFSLSCFIRAIEENAILIDFDARTGHNHGTKFRLRKNKICDLYDSVTEI